MRSSALACLVVLSLGLSAAPTAFAGDASLGGMGSMLAAYSRGLLSVDAAKKPKPSPKKKPHAKPHKKVSKPKPHAKPHKKPTKSKPHAKPHPKPVKKTPTKPKPTSKAPTKKPTKPVVLPPTAAGKNTIPKGAPGTVQPNVADPTPVPAKAGSGTCVSGPFTIFNAPLVAFADANKTCTSHKMSLADISSIFEPNDNKLMLAAQTAIQACEGSNAQVWFDTSLTATDTPATCNAFMVTNQPTAGTTAANGRRLAGATPLVLLASSVPAGCTAKLPVLCM